MTMNENEIVRSFKEAKKKREQIGILAELNSCSRDKIRDILIRNGISEAELPAKKGRRSAAETEEIQQQLKKNRTKVDELHSEKREPAAEQVEEAVKEPRSISELLTDDAEKTTCMVPEIVIQLCRNRIHEIVQGINEMSREKKELQEFLDEFAQEHRSAWE